MMHDHRWPAEVAQVWRNYVPPNRPSRFELEICSLEVERLRSSGRRSVKLLILGSTTEFRDWAFEESLEAVVVDSSVDYHGAVSAELTHFNPKESVIFSDWRHMDFDGEFDLVVGDLVVGQVPLSDYSELLSKIHASIRPGGTFLTKSFFICPDREPRDVGELLKGLRDQTVDPFPHVVYDLAVRCVRSDRVLHFADMIAHIRELWREGRVTDSQLQRFEGFGWDSAFKVMFTMPTVSEWESELSHFFPDFYTTRDPIRPHFSHIPMYTCRTTES